MIYAKGVPTRSMGIDIDVQSRVTFNAAHDRRIITDVNKNPAQWRHNGIDVVSVFKRVRSADELDGNPLIYALKGLRGYTTDYTTIRKLFENGRLICNSTFKGKNFDYVIPMPSSSPISGILAKRVANIVGGRLHICLRKATVAEALAGMAPIAGIAKRDRVEYGQLLNALQNKPQASNVEMKLVTKRLRDHISPIVALPAAQLCAGASVLVVDDLFGSGASVRSASVELHRQGAAHMSALTLLGRL